MDDVVSRVIADLAGRLDGPMMFRLVAQPAAAAIIAARDGWRDSRDARRPYLWSIASDPAHRGERLREGWKPIRRLFGTGLMSDAAYQVLVLEAFYPGEAVLVAGLLVVVPYAVVRGVVNRVITGHRLLRSAHRWPW